MHIESLRTPGAPWARRPLDGLNGAATAALSSTRWPEPPCQLLPRNKRALVPVPALRDRQPIDELVRGLARMTCFVGLRRSLVRKWGAPRWPPKPPSARGVPAGPWRPPITRRPARVPVAAASARGRLSSCARSLPGDDRARARRGAGRCRAGRRPADDGARTRWAD